MEHIKEKNKYPSRYFCHLIEKKEKDEEQIPIIDRKKAEKKWKIKISIFFELLIWFRSYIYEIFFR